MIWWRVTADPRPRRPGRGDEDAVPDGSAGTPTVRYGIVHSCAAAGNAKFASRIGSNRFRLAGFRRGLDLRLGRRKIARFAGVLEAGAAMRAVAERFIL